MTEIYIIPKVGPTRDRFLYKDEKGWFFTEYSIVTKEGERRVRHRFGTKIKREALEHRTAFFEAMAGKENTIVGNHQFPRKLAKVKLNPKDTKHFLCAFRGRYILTIKGRRIKTFKTVAEAVKTRNERLGI
jgi:hypothetical protein